MPSLRTPDAKNKYEDYLKQQAPSSACPLCNESPIKNFVLWKVINNNFPYDLIAETHHMIVPKRHITEKELTAAEKEEFAVIKQSFLNAEYDWIIEPTEKHKSIPNHFHLHLIVGKKEDSTIV